MTTIKAGGGPRGSGRDRRTNRGAVPLLRGAPQRPFPAQERPPLERLPGEVRRPVRSGGDERTVRVLGGQPPGPRWATARRSGGRADHGWRHPRLRDGPPARDAGDLRRGGHRPPTAPITASSDVVSGSSRASGSSSWTTSSRPVVRCWPCCPPSRRWAATIVECVVLVDRSGGISSITSPVTGRVYPVRALWAMDLETYDAGAPTCPLCVDGVPLYAPGSTGAASALKRRSAAHDDPQAAADRGHRWPSGAIATIIADAARSRPWRRASWSPSTHDP